VERVEHLSHIGIAQVFGIPTAQFHNPHLLQVPYTAEGDFMNLNPGNQMNMKLLQLRHFLQRKKQLFCFFIALMLELDIAHVDS
jgi:hypothetical protein